MPKHPDLERMISTCAASFKVLGGFSETTILHTPLESAWMVKEFLGHLPSWEKTLALGRRRCPCLA